MLYSTDDVGGLIDSVATSISSHIRNISSEVVVGQAIEMQNFVYVRWLWLILPLTLVSALIFFLAIIMWRGRSEESIVIWKSSGLASMFHGLEQNHVPQASMDMLDRQTDMEQLSKKIFVRLQETDNNVQRLVQRESSVVTASDDYEMSTNITGTDIHQDVSKSRIGLKAKLLVLNEVPTPPRFDIQSRGGVVVMIVVIAVHKKTIRKRKVLCGLYINNLITTATSTTMVQKVGTPESESPSLFVVKDFNVFVSTSIPFVPSASDVSTKASWLCSSCATIHCRFIKVTSHKCRN